MDAQLLKLSKQKDKALLKEFLNTVPNDKIADIIKTKLRQSTTNDNDTVLLIRSVLMSSPIEEGQSNLDRRQVVIDCVIEWLSSDNRDIIDKSGLSSSVVNLVLPEIELFPSNTLYETALTIINLGDQSDTIHSKLLDIFTKIWNALSAANEQIELNDVFEKLISANWGNQSIVGVCSAMNEMELSNKQLEQCIDYMIRKLHDVDLEGVPPFIYQLLLVSRKGHKKNVLKGIFDYFKNEKDDISVEGTAMLHISFAVKQDQELGNELVKIMKTNKMNQLDIFSTATLLSVARIHRLQDTIIDLFKSAIISAFKDNERYQQCNWITKYSTSDSTKFSTVLLEIADRSAAGWDQVIQSMTRLSFILIDSVANQGAFFATNHSRNKTSGEPNNANSNLANLAICILARLFKHHDVVRSEILEQITSRIVTRSNSANDFVRLLEIIIRDYPHAIEKHLTTLKDTLDLLSYLPFPIAERLLNAVRPVIKTNQQFRDDLILVLRKSLFAKDIDGREVAVRGFLNVLDDLLAELKQNGTSSQAESVAFEILGLLRRCFSQQSEIRACAYNGLGTLSEDYTTFAGDVFELLSAQFMKSFERNTSVPCPIKLDSCIEPSSSGGFVKTVEPIHILLLNTCRSLQAAASDSSTCSLIIESINRFRSHIKSFIIRLSNAALEDLELDKTTSFDVDTYEGQKNIQYAMLLLPLYEIAIDYEYSMNEMNADTSEVILSLFKKRKDLMDLLSSTSDRSKKTINANKPSSSLKFITKVFKDLFANENNLSEPLRNLKSNIELVHFVVISTGDSLKAAINDPYRHRDEESFNICIELCQLYLQILAQEDSDSIFANNQSFKKGPSVLISLSNHLLSILEIIRNVWPSRFVEFLASVCRLTDSDQNTIIASFIESLRDIVMKFLSGRSPIYKEVSSIMQVISFLTGTFDKSNQDYSQHARQITNWVNELAKDRPIKDTGLTKELISLLIRVSSDAGENHIIHDLCADLHAYAGEIESSFADEDEPMETNIHYQIISNKTFNVIISQVFDYLDHSLDELIWAISKLRLYTANAEEDVPSFEQDICEYFILYMKILSELVRTVLSDTSSENLFKNLAKLYKALQAFVKYKLAFIGDISQTFIKVISISGSDITDRMYKFLTIYGQRQQLADVSHGKKKNKGKRRKEINTKQEARVQRESRMIPQLIYSVEQYERHLIQLSRKSRVDFMQYMKRSTSRDFKIEISLLNEESSSEDEKENTSSASETPSKRARLS
ncbi:hypothetical protein G6F68_002062 [Rhizopus microsporus]|nr:hypothetical protein G6F69_003144 [Rhizopus microsporus]KAG1235059.1 hypothetical protein G6F67_003070 [Rhizopus microsporus]KAG1267261.1 hypothetical protein G6F68_002062 [Rhizopus microsporus]